MRDVAYAVRAQHVAPDAPLLAGRSDECLYEMKRFAIGRTMLTIWVDSHLDELDAATSFAEILLKPHERDAS